MRRSRGGDKGARPPAPPPAPCDSFAPSKTRRRRLRGERNEAKERVYGLSIGRCGRRRRHEFFPFFVLRLPSSSAFLHPCCFFIIHQSARAAPPPAAAGGAAARRADCRCSLLLGRQEGERSLFTIGFAIDWSAAPAARGRELLTAAAARPLTAPAPPAAPVFSCWCGCAGCLLGLLLVTAG